jgi:hypothetical protein
LWLGNLLLLSQSSCVLLSISFLILRFFGLVCQFCSELSFPLLLCNELLLYALFLGNLGEELAIVIRNQIKTARLAIFFKGCLHLLQTLSDVFRFWTSTDHAVFAANLFTEEFKQVLV